MSQPESNEESVKIVVAQRIFKTDGGLADISGDNLEKAFALLNPAEFAGIVANRMVVERAKGVLMHVYDLDADDAFELLKWGSNARDIEVWLLARQLTALFTSEHPACSGRADQRLTCDDMLFTVR